MKLNFFFFILGLKIVCLSCLYKHWRFAFNALWCWISEVTWQYLYLKYFCLLSSLLPWLKAYQTLADCGYTIDYICPSYVSYVDILMKHLFSKIIEKSEILRTKCTISAEDILMTRIRWHAKFFYINPLQNIHLRISRNCVFPPSPIILHSLPFYLQLRVDQKLLYSICLH